MVAATTAVSSANDASQDYKTLQLLGLPPRHGFLAQLIGGLSGCFVVPCALYTANEAYSLGTMRLIAPQGQMFATLVDGLLISRSIPVVPVCVGLAIGGVAVAADVLVSRHGMRAPALALAVGTYLPAELGAGILVGAMCRLVGERVRQQRLGKVQRTHESILAAAGLITGSAFADLVLGLVALSGFELSSLQIFTASGETGKIAIPAFLQMALSMGGLACVGAILFYNSLHGVADTSAENPDESLAGEAGDEKSEEEEEEEETPSAVGTPVAVGV
mmetsp:Transcript_19738/g.50525  ORF Transcript_19738/g.50525 Transcript_19738/m.50525 type:complete len:276 (+) Transcript_19738:2-829(+)